MFPVDKVIDYDPVFAEVLSKVRVCAEVALKQGPLSKRNALMEIQALVEAALTPPPQ